jgi:cell fate regulator YaaT (PSP1 superfamily)
MKFKVHIIMKSKAKVYTTVEVEETDAESAEMLVQEMIEDGELDLSALDIECFLDEGRKTESL